MHREFHAAVIDEADSILIDEARVPLVIAGGESGDRGLAYVADQVVRGLRPGEHFTIDPGGHNVALTDAGIHAVESALGCGNLFDDRNLPVHGAVEEALHAHALLHRDIDYIVKNGAIEMVDEFKGRIALDRRWPAGLHTAIEAKEGVAAKSQGMILGQITLQHLVALYPTVCGMTGTAATQSLEFLRVYGLQVETIPTNRPMIRVDHPDVIFPTKAEKEQAVAAEIRRVHATGQPVLVGTASVADSERLSALLADVPHEVLNARHDEREAAIVARAGERGAVTVSTNMAGRGTDIRLGDGVVELGGLYVIGTNKHESRRIDNQLRGRAGRQGDPGSSRFFISIEDDLMVRYGELDARYRDDPDTLQRLIEGQHLDTRIFLHGYEVPFEGQRNKIHAWRQEILESDRPEREKRDHAADHRRSVGGPPGARLRVPGGCALGLLERPRSASRVPAEDRRVVPRNGGVAAGRDRAPRGIRRRGHRRSRRRLDVPDDRPALRPVEARILAPVAVCDRGDVGNGGVKAAPELDGTGTSFEIPDATSC